MSVVLHRIPHILWLFEDLLADCILKFCHPVNFRLLDYSKALSLNFFKHVCPSKDFRGKIQKNL